jgi:hypothetical protein
MVMSPSVLGDSEADDDDPEDPPTTSADDQDRLGPGGELPAMI